MLAVSKAAAVYIAEMQLVCLCNIGQKIMHVKHDIGTLVKVKALVFKRRRGGLTFCNDYANLTDTQNTILHRESRIYVPILYIPQSHSLGK